MAEQDAAITAFVETGTYLGETTRWASAHFRQVFSIELSEALYRQAAINLSDLQNVTLMQGNSGTRLADALRLIQTPALFWLDGHYSFGVTAGEQHECPVLSELRALAGRGEDIVLIDDAHMFMSPPKPPHRAADWPLLPQIFDALRAINPNYFMVVHENVVVAVPESLRQTLETDLRSETQSAPRAVAETLESLGLWDGVGPLRLHLGCGEQRLDGYVNIDFLADRHNVMRPQADFEADITELTFSDGSVDEIRLHHVFEHFNRVTALALLIKWHHWLRPGGHLHIETPDLMGSARTLLSDPHRRTQSAVVRHLVGDQSATWAYHVDQWYAERFQRTLCKLGYSVVALNSTQWPQEPFLSNISVIAEKTGKLAVEEQLKAAEQVLWDSTVSDEERPTFEVWRTQLYSMFGRQPSADFAPEDGTRELALSNWSASPDGPPADLAGLAARLAARSSQVPLDQIHDFNQLSRNRWVAARAAEATPGSRVLDVGAGTCLYRDLFAQCDYVSHDFLGYDGYRDNTEGAYGHIAIQSDITEIPVPDASFDIILCTEVLEHVPEPILALKEMVRITKPGGRLLLTAPLGSGLHQLPLHFYGGFSPEWYRKFLGDYGCRVLSITPNGGFYKLLAQECARIAWTMDQHRAFHGGDTEMIGRLFGDVLPRYLFAMDEAIPNGQFTVGYHVEAVKK
ncbi:class I SAM-dependent methyltransferase [uncultured Thiodictyon sp.]|uniref:methyltransferase domain-containing protein n=1 Tax=uncultured Thiodictyon sp. TaxID=1846217 RepID=UPI0025F2F4C0|nr:class I SAM-dependent methyltransferase [uncultured Thiodictyon sp.]